MDRSVRWRGLLIYSFDTKILTTCSVPSICAYAVSIVYGLGKK